ncbi:hypothetical protein OG978_25860 [Streptomyces sp. NBC_01591]|uniref:hypothetical protein n=1 Tax=Streptomyces sp. NBC_01591 TaxID=2975888 RepID=UPI002DD89469|nr:hypothetical protein [Streptomyces sp. NBC_01591]WSD70502.1 hypothetical protein OG978_25860 [Streptomyces sp. NBC_01591]
MLKSRVATVFGAVAAATMLTMTTASAVDGHERATGLSGPGWDEFECADQVDSRSCFFHDGDWFAIEDTDADGHSAVVKWWVTSAFDENAPKLRSGYIWNIDGNNTLRYKNKDLPENEYVWFQTCTGEWSTHKLTSGSCSLTTVALA